VRCNGRGRMRDVRRCRSPVVSSSRTRTALLLLYKMPRLSTRYYNQDLCQRRLHSRSFGSFFATIERPYTPFVFFFRYIKTAPMLLGGWLQLRPFSGLPSSAGELLHIPGTVPTFMVTFRLFSAGNSLLLSLSHPCAPLNTVSVHSASPVLLTSSGPLAGFDGESQRHSADKRRVRPLERNCWAAGPTVAASLSDPLPLSFGSSHSFDKSKAFSGCPKGTMCAPDLCLSASLL